MSKSRKNSARMNMIHFKTLVSRYTRQIVSSPQSFLMLILQVPVMLIIVALIYKKDSFNIIEYPQNFFFANTMVFVLVFIGALMGLLNSFREITKEKDVLKRELSGGLDPVSYVTSKLFVLGVIAFLQAALLCLGTLIFIDFRFSNPLINFLQYFGVIFAVILASSSLGLMISSIVKKSESAILPVLLIIICQVVLSGVFLDLSKSLEIFSFLFPAKWGCAVLGNILNINAIPIAVYNRSVYKIEPLIAYAALVLIIFASYTITISIIRKLNKKTI